MKTAIFAIVAAACACWSGALWAQAVEAPAPPFRATLAATAGAVANDATATFALTLEFAVDCTVSNTLLTGCNIEAFVDGTKRHTILTTVDGETRLLAGTKLTRPVEVDLKLVMDGDVSAEGMKFVTMRWGGISGAEAQIAVYPNQTELDLDKLDLSKTRVQLVTSHGEMWLEFDPANAPRHVRNFVKLSKDGFYNGTRFHRVIAGFMIQGGCPNTKIGATGVPGQGDAGYKLDAEFNNTSHVRGVLSAARVKDPNSAGSQFFIMHDEAAHLDRQYTAYGRLVQGFDTLDKIATTPVPPGGSTPIEPVYLHAAIVIPAYKE